MPISFDCLGPSATESSGSSRVLLEHGFKQTAQQDREQIRGSDHLKLVKMRRHLEALFQNHNVVRYLTQHHAEVFDELRKLVDSTKILSGTADSAETAVA